METPYGRTYWVKPGQFLAGAWPDALDDAGRREKLDALLSAGIRRFINLVEPDESPLATRRLWDYSAALPGDAAMVRFPIPVGGVPEIDAMTRLLHYIDALIDRNIPLFVHSFAGRGRTGVVTGCWLLHHGLANEKNVLDVIARLRAKEATAPLRSPQTPIQVAFVRDWIRVDHTRKA